AGGLDPFLEPGTVFLPGEVVSVDGASAVATDQPWREQLAARVPRTVTRDVVFSGRLLTTPKSVGTEADKAMLFQRTGAAAVDMESLAIAEVARARQVPFIAVRVIVDGAGDSLPSAVTAAADSEGHLRIGHLLGRLARTPAELPVLIRLGR